MEHLKSKVAVVTGAGNGIGREIAIALADEGTHLALCDISEEGLEETRKTVLSSNVNVSLHQTDVSQKSQIEALTTEVIDAHRHVHILINNAGIASFGTFEDQALEDFERVQAINFYGVVYGCKYFLPYLKEEAEAHIVNMCSIFGLMGFPIMNAYGTSKFAVRGFSESLWHEVKEYNIGVTVAYPGNTRTHIGDSAKTTKNIENNKEFTKYQQELSKRSTPPKRVAKRIIASIKKNRREVITGLDTAILSLLTSYAPKLALKIPMNLYRRFKGSLN